jgi:hypothetical protein
MLIFHVANSAGTFHRLWVFTEVAVVRFDTLILSKLKLQVQNEYFDIRPIARRKGPNDPDYVSHADPCSNLIPQSTVLELE